MVKQKTGKKDQSAEFADLLRNRREVILNNWREQCNADVALTSKNSFTREEFNDQMPSMLDVLDQRLRNIEPSVDPVLLASEHGLHRWQSGYALHELVIELEHLFRLLYDEVQAFDPDYTKFNAETVSHVHREINRIYAESNRGSVIYYYELRQTAAAEQAASLQGALDKLQQLGKKRNEHLRHSSHDLRSSFSVIMMASKLWQMPTSEEERNELMNMLNKNLTAVRDMLLQLTDYARIEAGQETLDIKSFNVADLIKDVTHSAQPAAEHRKLTLSAEGPDKLEITSDKVQIQRILQNLLYNALKYTEVGGVYVTWTAENDARWVLSIQDTGPGFPQNSPAALLADQLRPAIHTSAVHHTGTTLERPSPTVPDKKEDESMKESEGLGLFIVKKICDLMKATMDIESNPNQGTLVRIRFQTRQEKNAP